VIKENTRYLINSLLVVTFCLTAAVPVFLPVALQAAEKEVQKPFWNTGRHFQLTGDSVNVEEDGVHDPTNITVKYLQQPYDAMASFPRDDAGIIDWVKVLDQGLIDPRKSVDGSGEMFTVDFDIIFENTASMPNVRFPHRQHTEWLTCANCHPAIFIPQKGANPISMNEIIQGKYCGVCHGKVAFPPTMNCGRCHSVANTKTLLR